MQCQLSGTMAARAVSCGAISPISPLSTIPPSQLRENGAFIPKHGPFLEQLAIQGAKQSNEKKGGGSGWAQKEKRRAKHKRLEEKQSCCTVYASINPTPIWNTPIWNSWFVAQNGCWRRRLCLWTRTR